MMTEINLGLPIAIIMLVVAFFFFKGIYEALTKPTEYDYWLMEQDEETQRKFGGEAFVRKYGRKNDGNNNN